MRKEKDSNKSIKNIRTVPLIPVYALLVVYIFVLVNGLIQGKHTITNFFALKDTVKFLEERVDGLKSHNATILTEIEKIEKSKSYAKKVLKERYHVLDEGEKIIFFEDHE